jgi:hypothetical protein
LHLAYIAEIAKVGVLLTLGSALALARLRG